MLRKTENFNSRQFMNCDDFEIHFYNDNNLNDVPLHHHDFYEIYFFISGNASYRIEDKTFHLLPKDILLINPNELHQPIFPKDYNQNRYERVVLWINKKFLINFKTSKTNVIDCLDVNSKDYTNLLRLDEEKQSVIYDLMSKILIESNAESYGADMLCMTYIATLLIMLNRYKESTFIKLEKLDKSEIIISNIVNYINTNYKENLSLDSIANKFFISKYYLCHEFNRLMDTSPYRYLIQKRLMNARALLRTGVLPTEVHQTCGFGDYANFYRAFKSEYGVSPKEYIMSLSDD